MKYAIYNEWEQGRSGSVIIVFYLFILVCSSLSNLKSSTQVWLDK